MLREVMEPLGVEFHMSDRVEQVDATPALALQLRLGKRLEPEALLVALGRSNVAALKLENAGVRLDEQGQLLVNEHFQTNVPHIYAAGDVIGGHALASTAMAEARAAMDHAFSLGDQFRPRGLRRDGPDRSRGRLSALGSRSGPALPLDDVLRRQGRRSLGGRSQHGQIPPERARASNGFRTSSADLSPLPESAWG